MGVTVTFEPKSSGLVSLAKKKSKDWDPNPWAVCHTTVDKDKDPEKFERCVKHVKEDQEPKKKGKKSSTEPIKLSRTAKKNGNKYSIELTHDEWTRIGAANDWFPKTAGEDWLITDEIKAIIPQVAEEINRRGGECTVVDEHKVMTSRMNIGGNTIPAKFEITLYDGTYDPGKVMPLAYFFQGGQRFPVPTQNRTPYDAVAIVDEIDSGFMSLVRHATG